MYIKNACQTTITNPWEIWVVKQTNPKVHFKPVPVTTLNDLGIELVVQLLDIKEISLTHNLMVASDVAMTIPDGKGGLSLYLFPRRPRDSWKDEINGFLEANTDLIPVLCKPGLDWPNFHGFEKYLVHRMGEAFIKTDDRIFLCQLGGTVRVMLNPNALEALKGFSTVRWGDSCLEAFIHSPEVGRNTPF